MLNVIKADATKMVTNVAALPIAELGNCEHSYGFGSLITRHAADRKSLNAKSFSLWSNC